MTNVRDVHMAPITKNSNKETEVIWHSNRQWILFFPLIVYYSYINRIKTFMRQQRSVGRTFKAISKT